MVSTDEFIILAHTQDKNLAYLLDSVAQKNGVALKDIGSYNANYNMDDASQILLFIIGSDVEDPIQSAQRFYSINKNARVILLADSDHISSIKQSLKFSPFIGAGTICLNEDDNSRLEKEINNLIETSLIAEKHRSIIAESNLILNKELSEKSSASNHPNFINRLLDIAPIGIVIIGESGTVHAWNREAAQIFDKSEADILGTRLPEIFNTEEKYKIEDYITRHFRHVLYEQKEPFIIQHFREKNQRQFLEMLAASFWNETTNERAVILTIQDITNQKLAEEELQNLNVTLEEKVEARTASLVAYQSQLRSLASKLSRAEESERHRLAAELHDHLGQMLAVLKMKVDLLQRNSFNEKIDADLKDIRKGVEDALIYTRDLMSDLKPPPTLDQDDIRASMNWLVDKFKKHGMEVTHTDDGKSKAVTDEIRPLVIQSVRELLFNVLKHSGVKKAELNLERQKNRLLITVSDKGKGFDPAKRKDFASNDGGFGLFNIKERIDLLGGSVNVKTKPGYGTEITINIPALAERAEYFNTHDDKKAVKNNVSKRKGRVKVLLADDHEMIRIGLKKIVNEQDDLMVIAEASNGEEAIKLAEETQPDIVVMDVNMPVLDGIKATKTLKQRLPHIQVIALSFHDHHDVINSMKDAGASAYLTKSEAFEALCATIRSEAGVIEN